MSRVEKVDFIYDDRLSISMDIKVLDDAEVDSTVGEFAEFIDNHNDEISLEDFEIFILKNTIMDIDSISNAIGKKPELYTHANLIRSELLKLIYALNPKLDPRNLYINKYRNKMIIKPKKIPGYTKLSSLFVYGGGNYISVVIPNVNVFATIKAIDLEEFVDKINASFILCKMSRDAYKAALSSITIKDFEKVIHRVCSHKKAKDQPFELIADWVYQAVIRVNPHLEFSEINWGSLEKMLEKLNKEGVDIDSFFESNHDDARRERIRRIEKLRDTMHAERKNLESKTKTVKKGTFKFSNINKSKIVNLYEEMKKFIYGQDEALEQIYRAVKRSKAGIKDPERPVGSFIFAGQTGVGKTYCAKVLAKSLDTNVGFLKINCSELALNHEAIKLLGAPPSYVGYEKGGMLTNFIAANPTSVVLFDEFEKAHDRVQELLLQVIEDGELVDSQGNRVSFSNCIIILTTNLGAVEINQAKNKPGFLSNKCDESEQKDIIIKSIEKKFKPEFVNRLNSIVFFKSLNEESYRKIIEFNLNLIFKMVLKNNKINLTFSDLIRDYIYNNSLDDRYGARPIRRFIEKNISDPIADSILEDIKIDKLYLDIKNDEVVIEERVNIK